MSSRITTSAEAVAYYQKHGYAPGAIESLTKSFGDLHLRPRDRFMEIDYGIGRDDRSLDDSSDKHFSDTSSFGTAEYSDISEEGIRRAVKTDQKYFRPTLAEKLGRALTKKEVVIGVISLCILSGICLAGLPTQEQAEEAGFKLGQDRAISAIQFALDYMDHGTKKNITALFTRLLTKRG